MSTRWYPQQQFQALWGLWRLHVVGRAVIQARPLADQLFVLAQQADDPAFACWRPIMRKALRCSISASSHTLLPILKPPCDSITQDKHRALAFLYGQEEFPGVMCSAFAALTLWMLGYPEPGPAGGARRDAGVRPRIPSVGPIRCFGTANVLLQCCGRSATVAAQAEEAIALSAEHGFTLWQARGHDSPRLGVGAARRCGARHDPRSSRELVHWVGKRPRPYLLALLSETYIKTRQRAQACRVLAEALAETAHDGEQWWEAELHRLRGEVLLAQRSRQEAEAEACFQQARTIAVRQQAKSLATPCGREFESPVAAPRRVPERAEHSSWPRVMPGLQKGSADLRLNGGQNAAG